MVDVVIQAPQPADCVALAENLRPSDIAEIRACGHDDMLHVVRSSVAQSLLCWSAFADGELACIIGVAPLSVLGGIGAPWMLGTPVLDRHSRILVRRTPDYIAAMLTAFPHLVNYVHADNTTSVRWLRRLGFVLDAPTPYGTRGALFHRFEMRG